MHESRPPPIAITGVSCRFPNADSTAEFWKNLLAGDVAITGSRQGDLVQCAGVLRGVGLFDHKLFGMTRSAAKSTDPQLRLSLTCVWEALERAGRTPRKQRESCGLFMGCRPGSYGEGSALDSIDSLAADFDQDSEFIASRIAYHLDLRGPVLTVQGGCASGLAAVHAGAQSLLARECDVVLAGAVGISFPQHQGYAAEQGGIMSPSGVSRPFDFQADGVVGGHGAAFVVLRRRADAERDREPIEGILLGSALLHDGADRVGFTAPSPKGQQRVIDRALERAGIEAEAIGYVEAHGTGTPVGDAVEVAAVNAALHLTERDLPLLMGSVKGNVGHLGEVAGMAGLVKALLVIKHGLIPGTPGGTNDERVDGNLYPNSNVEVVRRLRPWSRPGARIASVSSFGLGGTNVHAVVGQAPEPPTAVQIDDEEYPVFVSGATEGGLVASAQRYESYLLSAAPCLRDACYTSMVAREQLSFRAVIMARRVANRITTRTVWQSVDSSSTLLIRRGHIPSLANEYRGASGPCAADIGVQAQIDAAENLLRLGLHHDHYASEVGSHVCKSILDGSLTRGAAQGMVTACEELLHRREPAGRLATQELHTLASRLGEVPLSSGRIGEVPLEALGDLREEFSLPALETNVDDLPQLDFVVRAFLSGAALDWLQCAPRGRIVDLPTYAFDEVELLLSHEEVPAPPGPTLACPALQGAPRNFAACHALVLAIFREVLADPGLDPSQEFFAAGGTSLGAARLAGRLSSAVGTRIGLDRLFVHGGDSHSVATAVEAFLGSGKTAWSTRNNPWNAEHPVAPLGPAPSESLRRPIRRVLLTGATGFVGSHILKALLALGGLSVTCIARSRHSKSATARVRQHLLQLGLSADLMEREVRVLEGDLREEDLGLSGDEYAMLQSEIDVVIHCAATVNFALPLSELLDDNVLALDRLMRLVSGSNEKKRLHFISSLAVVDASTGHSAFEESSPLPRPEGLMYGYAQSKYLAERLIVRAQEDGWPMTIHRIGILLGDPETGHCNANDLTWRILRESLRLGRLPDRAPEPAADVTAVARAIAFFACREDPPRVTHLCAEIPLAWEAVGRVAIDSGYELELVSADEWEHALNMLSPHAETGVLGGLFSGTSDDGAQAVNSSTTLSLLPRHLSNEFKHPARSLKRTIEYLAGSGYMATETALLHANE